MLTQISCHVSGENVHASALNGIVNMPEAFDLGSLLTHKILSLMHNKSGVTASTAVDCRLKNVLR